MLLVIHPDLIVVLLHSVESMIALIEISRVLMNRANSYLLSRKNQPALNQQSGCLNKQPLLFTCERLRLPHKRIISISQDLCLIHKGSLHLSTTRDLLLQFVVYETQAPLPKILQKHEGLKKQKAFEGATRFDMASLFIPNKAGSGRLAGSGGTESLGSSPHVIVKSSYYPRKGSLGPEPAVSPLKINYRFSSRKLSQKPKVLSRLSEKEEEENRYYVYPKGSAQALKRAKSRQGSVQKQGWLPGSLKKLEGMQGEVNDRSSSVPRSMKYQSKFISTLMKGSSSKHTASRMSENSRHEDSLYGGKSTSRAFKTPITSTRVIDSSMLSQYFASQAQRAAELHPISESRMKDQSSIPFTQRVSGVPVNMQPLPSQLAFLQTRQTDHHRNIWSAGGQFMPGMRPHFGGGFFPHSRERTSETQRQRVFTANTTKTRSMAVHREPSKVSKHNYSVMATRDSPLLNYESRRQSHPTGAKVEEEDGIPSTKGIYSKIKGELMAQRQHNLASQYDFIKGMTEVHIPEEEKRELPKVESSEQLSDQVPQEPAKPTISALSFPTDIISDRKQEEKEEEDSEEGQIDEIEKLQKEFSETYMSKSDRESMLKSTQKVHRLKLALLPRQISRNNNNQTPLTQRTLQHFRKHHQRLLEEDSFDAADHKLASARGRDTSRREDKYNNQLEAITSRLDNIVTNLEKFNEKIQTMGRVSAPSQIMTPSSVHNIHPNIIGEIPFSDQSSKLSETRMMFTSASIGHKPSTQRNSARDPAQRKSIKLKLKASRTLRESRKQDDDDDLEEIKFDELSSFASGPSTPHLSQIDSAYGTVPARKLSPTAEKRGSKIIINLDVARTTNESRTEISEPNQQQPQGGQMADNRKF